MNSLGETPSGGHRETEELINDGLALTIVTRRNSSTRAGPSRNQHHRQTIVTRTNVAGSIPSDTASEEKRAAMSPQNECVETVKVMVAEVMHEKNALVERLNAMHQGIVEEDDPVTKVRRKVEWAAEKDSSVEALNRIVASLQRVLEKQDRVAAEMAPAARSTHGSTASREKTDSGNVSGASSAASHLPGASSQSFTDKHASSKDAFERTMAKTDQDSSYKAGAAEPRQEKLWWRSSSLPARAHDVWPLPARLDKDHCGRPASMPTSSKTAGVVTRLSSEAAQLQQQVRQSVKKGAWKFSASFLRRVGWDPAPQKSERNGNCSV